MGDAGGLWGANTSFSGFIQGLFEYVSSNTGVAFNVELYSFTWSVVDLSFRIIAIWIEIPVFTENFQKKICESNDEEIIYIWDRIMNAIPLNFLGYFNILIELKITRIFHSDILYLVTSVEQIYYTGAIRNVKMGKVV